MRTNDLADRDEAASGDAPRKTEQGVAGSSALTQAGARHDAATVPRRILVWGATGSGKTTLTRRLADLLGLGVIEIDSLFWKPGWEEASPQEFRQKVLEAIARYPQGWVSDGNYFRVRDLLLPRADAIVWLKLPWRVSFWRLLRRTITRAWRADELWNSNRESWRTAFLSRDSILWWSIGHHREHRRHLAQALTEVPAGTPVYVLRSSRDVRSFTMAIAHRVSASGSA